MRLILTAAIGIGLMLSNANADRVTLSSGETLTVTVVSEDDKEVHCTHPILGELTIARENIQSVEIDAPAEAEGAAGAEAKPAEEKPADDAAALKAEKEKAEMPPAEQPPAPWKFKLVAGAGFASGNTDNANFSTIFTAVREATQTKLAFDAGYFYAESDDVRSQNRFTAGVRHDWLNPGSRLFWFADGRYDYDEFQSWDSRVNAHVGPGYRIILPPKFELNALAGIGFVKEWGSDNEDVRPEALAGIEGAWEIAEKHTLKFSSTIYPDLDDTREFRNVNEVMWSCLLDKKTNLSITAGIQHEYQSNVDPGRDKNDVRGIAGLQLEF